MKRNAPRANNPARLARLRDQAIKLRERVKRSKLAFVERSQARLAWWRRAFRVPMVADWAIFTKAKTHLSAFMALLGLASGKKSSLVALLVEGSAPQAFSLQLGSSDILFSRKPEMRKASRKGRRLHVEGLEQRQLMAADFPEFVDPRASFAGNQFGHSVVALSGGNVVITSPFDDAGGTNAGAIYLFNGETGALISTLTGSTANDNVGSSGVTALDNGNYVVMSANWDNGAVVNAGAVTFGSGTTGVSGSVSAANSLVGSTNGDMSTAGVTALKSGSYLVISPLWDNGAVLNVGAISSTSDTLEVLSDNDDTIQFGNGWLAEMPKIINGQFTHILSEAAEGGTGRIEVRNNRFIQNPLNRFDVDRDGFIRPLDALVIINSIRRRGVGPFTLPTTDSEISRFYFDVSGTNNLTPLEALLVINAIRRREPGTGESPIVNASAPSIVVDLAKASSLDSSTVIDSVPSLKQSITTLVETRSAMANDATSSSVETMAPIASQLAIKPTIGKWTPTSQQSQPQSQIETEATDEWFAELGQEDEVQSHFQRFIP